MITKIQCKLKKYTIQMKWIQYKWNWYNTNEIYTIQISNIQYKWKITEYKLK